MWTAIQRGTAVGVRGWENTAALAREDGFTPTLYESLFTSLGTIDVGSFAAHPGNRAITHPRTLPGIPYEPGLWQEWPVLVLDEEWNPHAATTLCLLFGEKYFPQKQ
ncbi:hypothetical protein [Brevibacterium casei]